MIDKHLCKLTLLSILFQSVLHTGFGCGFKWPGANSSYTVSPSNKIPSISETDFDSQFPNHESELELINSENHMISAALHVIVNFVIESGGLEFTCPQNSTTFTNATYPDPLDCKKYYYCDQNQNLTQETCEPDEGFDNAKGVCVPRAGVPLCESVESRPDLKCNSTGLQIFNGDCTKFVLCTKMNLAFVAICNEGDFFDQKLLICLPNTQSLC